jgi:hypothetical protein
MIDQKAAGHWGDNNPKKVAWPEVKKALVGSKKRSGGAAKMISAVKNRWQKVRTLTQACLCMRDNMCVCVAQN